MFRLVCTKAKSTLLKNLPLIAKNNDLHKCETIKELITAYAHQKRFWRAVPSFTFQERIEYHYVRNKKLIIPYDAKAVNNRSNLYLMAPTIILLAPEKIDEFLASYVVSANVGNIQKRTTEILAILYTDDWSVLKRDWLAAAARIVCLLGSHKLFCKLYTYLKAATTAAKIDCWKALVEIGVSPYYYRAFSFCGDLLERTNRVSYINSINRSANEYLLKRRLLKDGSGYVDDCWKWKRGQEICKKYKRTRR
jgi:hypothetical protein